MRHVDGLLSDYLDGELTYEAERGVQEHLAACDPCSRRFRSLRRTVRFIRGNGAFDVQPDRAAGGQARFIAAVMQPDSGDAEIARVMSEEVQRYFGGSTEGRGCIGETGGTP